MITINDIERVNPETKKKHRLRNLAKACADAKSNQMKSMWYNKMIDLAKEYDMLSYVKNNLIH